MAKRSSQYICTMSDISIYNSEYNGIPIVSRIQAAEGRHFISPEENQQKAIFKTFDNGDFGITTISTQPQYVYALISALAKAANNILTHRAEIVKTNNPQANNNSDSKTDPYYEERKKIEEQIKRWKDANKDNDELFTNVKSISVATRYYAGKAGQEIINMSGVRSLDDDQLIIIKAMCEDSKGSISEVIKELNDDNSPWITVKRNMTDKCKSIVEDMREELRQRYGIPANTSNSTYSSSLDHEENRQRRSKRSIQVDGGFELSERTLYAIDDFNRAFCINAINKDNLMELD